MPLLDLKTNLTTIKFGRDRINGGNSGQPYIQTPIIGNRYATQNAPQTLVDFANSNKNSLDYPIRGGGLDFEIGSQTLTISSKIDRARIEKFLKDAPRGEAFINKQIGLQLSNPKTETGNTFTDSFNNVSALPGIIENTRVYNYGKNTLAQVGVSGTGFHLPRAGLFPFDLTAKYYSDIVGRQNSIDSDAVQLENRLLILQQLKLRNSGQIVAKGTVLGAINKINQLGISLNRDLIQNYLGGPGSVYGIGNTTIRRFDDTTKAARKIRAGAAMDYDKLMSQTINAGRKNSENLTYSDETDKAIVYTPADMEIQDFKTGTSFVSGPREVRYLMSKRGQPDAIAQASIQSFESNPWAVDPNSNTIVVDDMIKFGFECVDNDAPTSGIFLQFRAYLIGGISDNNQANYNSFKYMGRGEDFFIYQGFTRTINFSFRVAVESPQDLSPLYRKINALVSQVYPDYSKNGVMRTSVTKVTIGDYLYRMPGFIENVNISIAQDSSWETEDGYQLPHYLDVAMTFRPINDTMPKRTISKDYPNSLLYNNPNRYTNSGPTQLNESFYTFEKRPLTEREIKAKQKQEKRSADREKRKTERTDRREQAKKARQDKRTEKEQEKAAKRVPPSYF